MANWFKKTTKSNLGYFLGALEEDDSNFFLTGLINVESGDISVRTPRVDASNEGIDVFSECSHCSSIEENVLFFVECSHCGKSRDNYFWLKAGDGDGVYTTFQILHLDRSTEESTAIGFAAILQPTEVFAEPLIDHILEDLENHEDPLQAFGFTSDFLNPAKDLEAFEITSFDLDGAEFVFLSDKDVLSDSSNSIVSMGVDNPGNMELTFLAFSESVGSPGDPYPNEVSPRPRVLIGIDSAWLARSGFKATMARPDSVEVFQDWAVTGIGTSHIQPMDTTTLWFNFKINEAMQKYNYAASWLLQGAVHGDEDCIKEIVRYEEFISDPEWVEIWLEQRRQFKAATKFQKTKKLPFKIVREKRLAGAPEKKSSKAVSSERVAKPDWASFRTFWSDSEIVISPAVAGFIDIEGGQVSISGKWLPHCEECYDKPTCRKCGRNPSNCISIRSGMGDGVYCVHELWFDQKSVGGLIIFDNGADYAIPIMNAIDQAHDNVSEDAEAETKLHEDLTEFIYEYLDEINPREQLYELGTLIADTNPVYSSEKISTGILVIGESGEGIDSDQSLVSLNNIKSGEYRVFAFASRDRENNNCLIPKALLILDSESAKRIGLENGFAQKLDLREEMELWNGATVFARIGEPLARPVIFHNYIWAQLRLVAGLEKGTIDELRALDLKLETLSWLLLLSQGMDSEEFLLQLREELETFSEHVESIHALRGQFGRDLRR